MSWVLAFLGFAALIILHELGHFTAAKAVGMIERHFGRLDRIAETPAARGVDERVVERLQRFADRVTTARHEMAKEEAVRSWKR